MICNEYATLIFGMHILKLNIQNLNMTYKLCKALNMIYVKKFNKRISIPKNDMSHKKP